jgi:hypothetical protein
MQKTCLVSAVGVHLIQKEKGMKTEESGLLGCDTVRSNRVHHFRGVWCTYLVFYSTYSSTLKGESKHITTESCAHSEPHIVTTQKNCVRFSNQAWSTDYLHHPGKWHRWTENSWLWPWTTPVIFISKQVSSLLPSSLNSHIFTYHQGFVSQSSDSFWSLKLKIRSFTHNIKCSSKLLKAHSEKNALWQCSWTLFRCSPLPQSEMAT